MATSEVGLPNGWADSNRSKPASITVSFWRKLKLQDKLIMIHKITTFILLATIASSTLAQDARGIRLADLCRVKGQEENRLQGFGLVVGLKGTGDSKLSPMTRQLASVVQKMGGSISADKQGVPIAKELESVGNVALVMVTATIPATGAQQGDLLDCSVDAIAAKSLQGGRLVLAYMLGPRADVPTVYGIASGQVTIPDITIPTAGMVHSGCKMEATVTNAFVQQNRMTLVINSEFASFATAADIQDAVNNLNSGMSAGSYSLAKALDQSHVVVEVPPAYADDPVRFAKLIMDVQVTNLKQSKRVVINEREGVIVIGENVVINPVAINHKNLTIQAGVGREPFVAFDPGNANPQPTLKNLVDALNKLKVPTDDQIAIIRSLKRNGDLFGEVVIQ